MSDENDIQEFDEIVKTHIEKLNEIIRKHDQYELKINKIKDLIDTQKNNNKRLSSVQSEKTTLESQIDSLKNKIEELEKELAEKNESGNAMDKEIQKLKLEIDKYKILLTEFELKISNFEEEIEKLKIDIDKKNTEELQLRKQIIELESEKKSYEIEIEKLKTINENNLEKIEEMIQKIRVYGKDTNIATEIQTELDKLTRILEQKEIELKKKQDLISVMKAQTSEQFNKLEKYNLDFNNKVKDLEKKMTENFNLLDELTSDLEQFNSDEDEAVSDIKKKLNDILKQVTEYDKTSLLQNKIIFIKEKTKEIIEVINDMKISISKKQILLSPLNEIVNINHDVSDNSDNKNKLKQLITSFKTNYKCQHTNLATKYAICGIFDKLKEIL
jgi:chromosome segregation protein